VEWRRVLEQEVPAPWQGLLPVVVEFVAARSNWWFGKFLT
jgi:hypothetical protein